jgi:RND family efflux transporter MFP subunit
VAIMGVIAHSLRVLIANKRAICMSRKTSVFLIILAITVGVIVLMIAGAKRPAERDAQDVIVPAVNVYQVVIEEQPAPVFAQGTVAPLREIDIVSRVSGIITDVGDSFHNGDFFEQGDSLVLLEQDDYEIALTRARAQLAEAERILAQEQGQSRQAAREWRDLGNDEANSLALRKPQLDAAEANVSAQRANVRQAELNLQRTRITAPFNLRVAEKFVELGQYVTPGQKIAHVYSTDAVQVRVPLTDRQVRLLNLPNRSVQEYSIPAAVNAVYGGKSHVWNGLVKRVEASLNVASQTVYAVIEINDLSAENTGTTLPVGLFVEVDIRGEVIPGSINLPRSALKPGNVIFVVRDGKLQFVEADLLQSTRTQVLVIADLVEGDQVVTDQMPYAVPGMAINIRGE